MSNAVMPAFGFRFLTLCLFISASIIFARSASWAHTGGNISSLSATLTPQEQSELEALQQQDAEDFLEVKVAIATHSGTKLTAREAPATVVVLTAEDIKINHARDLVDVFNMLPGFNMNVEDYSNELTLSARGLYIFLGRYLLMIDGMPLSGLAWGGYGALGIDFPIHLIDRIEITRSPGFVVYGGVSELAAVNIVTKSGSQLNSGQLRGRYGRLPLMKGTDFPVGHEDAGVVLGQKAGRLEYSLLAYNGEGMRSSGDDTLGIYRQPIPQRIDSAYVNDKDFVFKGTYDRNTEASVYYHQYDWNTMYEQFAYNPATDDLDALRRLHQYSLEYIEKGAAISHDFDLGGNFTLTPGLHYHYSDDVKPTTSNGSYLGELEIEQTKFSLVGKWLPGNLEVVAGTELTQDHGWAWAPPGSNLGFRKSINDPLYPDVRINGYSGFGSVAYRFRPFYVFTGARYEWNEIFGDVFVPRVGVTYVNGPVHSKLLYSQTYRPPTMENNSFNLFGLDPNKPARPSKITPEKGEVVELETGYKFTSQLTSTLNLFYQKLSNTIQFTASGAPIDFFASNGAEIGTWGGEIEVKYRGPVYIGWLNFSYDKLAEAGAATGPSGYVAPDDSNTLLGQPDYKLYTNHSYALTHRLSVQANALLLGPKHAQFIIDPAGATPEYTDIIPAQLILGLGLLWDEPIKDMNVGFSIHDLLNQQQRMAMAYLNGLHDPHQFKGTEVSIDVGYRF